MLKVFISGLERQTGKTIVTAGLAATMQSLSYSTSVYKPIQTNATLLHGFKTSPDLTVIKKFDPNITTDSTYVLRSSAPPFISSYEDNVKIDLTTIYTEFQASAKMTDCQIVEGSHSISTPIAEHLTEIDIVKTLNLPLILVVDTKKNTNRTCNNRFKLYTHKPLQILGSNIEPLQRKFRNFRRKILSANIERIHWGKYIRSTSGL